MDSAFTAFFLFALALTSEMEAGLNSSKIIEAGRGT